MVMAAAHEHRNSEDANGSLICDTANAVREMFNERKIKTGVGILVLAYMLDETARRMVKEGAVQIIELDEEGSPVGAKH
jgi:hypothetical protein